MQEYVYALHQLYTMLGDESDRNKVIKLWEGFNSDICEGLLSQRSEYLGQGSHYGRILRVRIE